MSSDYNLGKDFSASIRRTNPDSQQKLSALLNDFAGSDVELLSAFRLLFGNPIYVSLFLGNAPLRAADHASLNSIAKSCLSPALAQRVESFIQGYFQVPQNPTSANNQPSSKPSYSVRTDQPSAASSNSHFSVSESPEEATVFADDIPFQSHSGSQSTRQEHPPRNIKSFSGIPFKPILLVLLAILLGVAMFKIDAVCEPFGLCEKDTTNKKESKPVKEPADNSTLPEPQRPNDINQPSNPGYIQRPISPESTRQQQPSQAPYRPVPSPAPLRDEPLW